MPLTVISTWRSEAVLVLNRVERSFLVSAPTVPPSPRRMLK